MEGNLEVLALKYEKWFSKKANSRYRGQHIEIRAANFWNTKFTIFKNKQDVGQIRFNWKGEAMIRLDELVDESQEYIVKSKLGWKPHFEVRLDNGELLLTLRSVSKWYASKINLEVKKEAVELPIDEAELLLYCGFAVNCILANRAAAT